MIGKLVFLAIIVIGGIMFFHVNLTSEYEDMAKIRNQIEPSLDHTVELGLQQASQTNIQKSISEFGIK